nr:tRNA lysidine(34) synthetase TilS [Solimonas marina]
MTLPDAARRARVWVAFSGGLDSTLLLHLLREAGVGELRAVHVHHGLQAAADRWAREARRVCRDLGVPLTVRRVTVDADHDGGPEAAARAARYAVFEALLKPGDWLATAHHQDDQAETVLLRALRGSGIAGLAAMAPTAPLGRGTLWRPLLDQPRRALRAEAERRGLSWIDDPHNVDARYARSYLRTEIMPRLQRHWPQAGQSLARLAARADDTQALLRALAEIDLQALQRGAGLSVSGLLALEARRRRNALYYAWLAMGWPAPAEARLQRVEREMLGAREDATPLLRHESGELRRYRDVLFLMPFLPEPPTAALRWPARRRSLALPAGLGTLRLARASATDLTVRFARGGERLKPAGEAHTRTLKHLGQRAGLPPWLRTRLPLVYDGGELLAVAGFWRSVNAVALGLDLQWESALLDAFCTGSGNASGNQPL